MNIKQITPVVLLLAATGCGGRNYEYDKNYPLQGKTIVFGTPMVYANNLKDSVVGEEAL